MAVVSVRKLILVEDRRNFEGDRLDWNAGYSAQRRKSSVGNESLLVEQVCPMLLHTLGVDELEQ